MERKIATLEVYEDDEERFQSSHLDTGRAEQGKYVIRLFPNFVGQVDHLEQRYPWYSFAHELGHFLARVAKLQAHRLGRTYFSAVPQELEAWEVAHQILTKEVMPNPTETEIAAVGQYKSNRGL